MPTPCRPPLRLPVLDILRGCAVFAVFLQHLGDRFRPFLLQKAAHLSPLLSDLCAALLTRGHWGVDLFFVLSGFTLGLGLVSQPQKLHEPIRWRPFLARRARRILPGYVVALAVTLAANSYLLHSPHFAKAVLLHLTLLQGYISAGGLVWIGASWSLTTESHFYLATPWLARFLWPSNPPPHPLRRLLRWTLLLCASVWLLRSCLHWFALHPAAPSGLLELSQRKWACCRIDQFILGLSGSFVYTFARHTQGFSRLLSFARPASLVLILLSIPLDQAFYATPLGGLTYPSLSVGLGLLVLSTASLQPSRFLARFLLPIRFLGTVSYGFFLYHQVCLALVPRLLPAFTSDGSWSSLAGTAIVGGASALLAATISWFCIEAPALRLHAKPAPTHLSQARVATPPPTPSSTEESTERAW